MKGEARANWSSYFGVGLVCVYIYVTKKVDLTASDAYRLVSQQVTLTAKGKARQPRQRTESTLKVVEKS